MNSREHLLRHGVRTADLSAPSIIPPDTPPDDFWAAAYARKSSDEYRKRAAWIAWIAALAVTLAVAGLIAWGASGHASDHPVRVVHGRFVSQEMPLSAAMKLINGSSSDAAKALCSSAYDQAVKSGAHTVDRATWVQNCMDSFAAQSSDDQGDGDDATFTPDGRL